MCNSIKTGGCFNKCILFEIIKTLRNCTVSAKLSIKLNLNAVPITINIIFPGVEQRYLLYILVEQVGNSEEIQEFCELNFGVTFPLTEKL